MGVRSRDLTSHPPRRGSVSAEYRSNEKKTALNLIFSILIMTAIMLQLLLFSTFFWELFR